MSELNVYHHELRHNEYAEFYLKYEADKVISELIEKNERLASKDKIMASETIKDLFKELRHNKYKRCLAMARWCENALLGWMGYKESYSSHQRYIKVMLFTKWRKRWLELADKFKEVK